MNRKLYKIHKDDLYQTEYLLMGDMTDEEFELYSRFLELQKNVEFSNLESQIQRYLEKYPEERDAFEVTKMVMQLYVLKHGSITEVKCK